MPVCSQCGHEFEELERWGIINLCYDCARDYEKDLPKKAKKESPDVKFYEPPFYRGSMSYNTRRSVIEIRYIDEDEEWVCTALSHEFVHYLLHRMVDLKCTFQYDNISLHGQLDFQGLS